MTKGKELLQSVVYLNAEINALQEELEVFKSTLLKATDYAGVKVQSDNTQPYDDRYSRYMEKSENIDKKIDELVEQKDEISSHIDLIESPLYRVILRERYINNKSLEQISELKELQYSVRHIERLHGEALSCFNEKLSENGGKCRGMSVGFNR